MKKFNYLWTTVTSIGVDLDEKCRNGGLDVTFRSPTLIITGKL